MTASTSSRDDVKKQLPFLEGEKLENYKLHRRFDRMGRLVGDPAMKKLMDSHVMVIGLGGVGSYAAEALARSGVGKLTIVDFDLVCITNTNRQLHTMKGTIGKPKANVLGDRLRMINPKAEVNDVVKFYNYESSDELLDLKPDWVIDAIDSVTSKCHLLSECRKRNIKVVCAAGAGGKIDPTMVKVADLTQTDVDPLARSVRKILRQKFNFPRSGKFNIPCVFSMEPPAWPQELSYDNGEGFRCVCPQGQNEYFTCDNRNLILGNAGFVTGTFGFAAAGVVVRDIIDGVFEPILKPVEK